MTDDPTGPLSNPPTADEHRDEALTWMSEALDGLGTRIERGIELTDSPVSLTVYATLAQTHAILAAANYLGRIAAWLEGIELVDTEAQAEETDAEEEGVERPGNEAYYAICVCGHPITRRGNAFWTHDDPRRNKSLSGGHEAAPADGSVIDA